MLKLGQILLDCYHVYNKYLSDIQWLLIVYPKIIYNLMKLILNKML